jgi:hypothetical protein
MMNNFSVNKILFFTLASMKKSQFAKEKLVFAWLRCMGGVPKSLLKLG